MQRIYKALLLRVNYYNTSYYVMNYIYVQMCVLSDLISYIICVTTLNLEAMFDSVSDIKSIFNMYLIDITIGQRTVY